MTKKVQVALFGEQRRKAVIDADATEGAVVGLNLKWSDGAIVQEADIRGSGTSTTTTTVSGSVWTGPTLWSLILSIPQFIKSLAALATTGFVVRDGSGDAVTREIEAADERIIVTDGDGVAANPTVGMTDWPVLKKSIGVGETYTIPVGYQMFAYDEFVLDGGDLDVDGELIVLDDAEDTTLPKLILESSTTGGITIGDKTADDYGWRDITGQVDTRIGATNPTWTQIGAGPFYAYAFGLNDECFVNFHIPHDLLPSSDIHLHCHWLPSGTDVNTVKWEWYYAFAKGFNQAAFNTTGTLITAEQAGPGIAYQHMITETAAITIAALTEPDGFLLTRLRRVTNGGTDNANTIFVITTDVHYQSTNLATKNKAPNFYT